MKSNLLLAAPGRPAIFALAASVLALAIAGASLDVEPLGMLGLSSLMLLSLAALALATRELDRDVIYLTGLGALAGAAHARLSGGASLAILGAGDAWTVFANALAGGVVGAAAGDVARASHARSPRGALARGLAGDWWSDRRGLARWLAPLGWLVAAIAAMLVVLTIVLANSPALRGANASNLAPNFARYLDEVEAYPGALTIFGESLLRVWYAYGLLIPALAVCVNLPLRRQAELEADRMLSRVALAHCLTLAFLGARLLLAAISGLSQLSRGGVGSSTPYGDLAEVTAAIRDMQPPLIIFAVSLVCLGHWRLRYVRKFGWMPALGAATLAACGLVALGAVYLANVPLNP